MGVLGPSCRKIVSKLSQNRPKLSSNRAKIDPEFIQNAQQALRSIQRVPKRRPQQPKKRFLAHLGSNLVSKTLPKWTLKRTKIDIKKQVVFDWILKSFRPRFGGVFGRICAAKTYRNNKNIVSSKFLKIVFFLREN